MKNKNNQDIKKMAEEALNITSILLEYCKINAETHEQKCLYTGLKILNQKIDKLAFKVVNFK